MKTHKGGFTDQQNRERDANKAGKEFRETAEAMLIAAKGDINDVKNLSQEKIAEALEEKKNMEKKIQEIMKDEELKAKITENVERFSDKLNDLREVAKKSLEDTKQYLMTNVFNEENQKRVTEGVKEGMSAAQKKAEEGMSAAQKTAEEGMSAAQKTAEDLDKKRREAGITGENLKAGVTEGMDAASKGAKQVYARGLNFFKGLRGETRKQIDVNEGGKRKNKTKKLTKKEKKMKKARK